MQPFRKHTGIVVPLDKVNVDTDQIIPKQFLKRIERTGFGEFLFTIGGLQGTEKRLPILCCTRRAMRRRRFWLRKKFWLRVVTRACRLGAGGLWIPGGDCVVVRRYFFQQQP